MIHPDDVRSWLEALDEYLVTHDYTGPDPYDALASVRLGRLGSAKSRQAAIQINKRSPVDLRRVLGVPGVRMAKTLALVASSLRAAPWLVDAETRRWELEDQLRRCRNADGGWGYEFDVQMRWGGYNAGESNVIATYFAVLALIRTLSEEERESISRFIEIRLGRGEFIAYAGRSNALIHNANVLGAHALKLLKPDSGLAVTALDCTVRHQRDDGSWPYGDTPATSWADSFHTAYILRGMLGFEDKSRHTEEILRNGIAAWLQLGFEPDGTPRYYLGSGRQVQDVHNIATALSTLCRIEPFHPEAAEKIPGVLNAMSKFRRPDGTFTARRSGHAYMRWELAHAHHALADAYAWMSR